ncbi:YciI family protein [Kribbella antiqua]|uniref:YciI family protein n=1 Tax=Kribbella antiqua TaxID=2512217 RepID=UPI001049EE09|nr:YciI family protein [Kribbella antiqua]
MRYVVLIFRDSDRDWTAADDDGLRKLITLKDELAASGELVSSEGLLPPDRGRIVQIRDGARVVTDGPFVEAKEQFAGYFMVDVPDDARAEAIAAQVSTAVSDRVELRGTLISA